MACKNSENNMTPVAEEHMREDIVVTQQQFETEQMQLGKLEAHTFNRNIVTSGVIDVPPHNRATISSFVDGYITKTPLLIGDQVKKGQHLVSLENPEFIEIQQRYLEIAEQLNYLKSEFNRQRTLFDENITSEKNFLKAQSTYKSVLAEYNGLNKKLKMLNINPESVLQGQFTSSINIYSPINGYVTKVEVSNGIHVSPSDMIMEIIDTDHIHLELSVFEKDVLRLKKGQKITFKIPEASNQNFDAEVHLVGTTIDEKNRFVKVHAHILDESQANFIVGMFVEANIISGAEDKPALPKDALIEYEGAMYALVLEDKNNGNYTFEKVKINLGQQNETYAEILNANDLTNKTVLTQGGYMLLAEEGGGHDH
ncbi:efflux RND transporter periplasmic adaptor subunit [Aestuariibaculum suncheonense]